MKKFVAFMVIFLFSTQCFGLTLTQEQFDNLGYINAKIKDKYPQFKGFNGTKDDMKAEGVSNSAVMEEINKIDFDALNAENFEKAQEMRKVREQIIDKAIEELGKTGANLKHKDAIKAKLLDNMEV